MQVHEGRSEREHPGRVQLGRVGLPGPGGERLDALDRHPGRLHALSSGKEDCKDFTCQKKTELDIFLFTHDLSFGIQLLFI